MATKIGREILGKIKDMRHCHFLKSTCDIGDPPSRNKGRGVGRNFSRGGGVVLNVNFKRCFFAPISALTLYIVNV